MNKPCIKCLLLEAGKEDMLRTVKEHMEKIAEKDKCGDKEYKRRLAVCEECEWLSEGTCLKCGCYPEFRAAFIRQKCPYKKW